MEKRFREDLIGFGLVAVLVAVVVFANMAVTFM